VCVCNGRPIGDLDGRARASELDQEFLQFSEHSLNEEWEVAQITSGVQVEVIPFFGEGDGTENPFGGLGGGIVSVC
jgi:hypothetical protein